MKRRCKEETTAYLTILQDAHLEYQSRYRDQESLQKEGAFVQPVASRIVRMPNATKVELHDEDYPMQFLSYMSQIHDNAALIQHMVQLKKWEQGREFNFKPPESPIEILLKLEENEHLGGWTLGRGKTTYMKFGFSCQLSEVGEFT